MMRIVLRTRRVARGPFLLRVLPISRVARRAVYLDLWLTITGFMYWIYLVDRLDDWWLGASFLLYSVIMVFVITDD